MCTPTFGWHRLGARAGAAGARARDEGRLCTSPPPSRDRGPADADARAWSRCSASRPPRPWPPSASRGPPPSLPPIPTTRATPRASRSPCCPTRSSTRATRPTSSSTRYGADNNPFQVQTEWIAAHADELNIPFVTHVGDVVDRVGTTSEWVAASDAMKSARRRDVPYSILPGNHDVRNSNDALDRHATTTWPTSPSSRVRQGPPGASSRPTRAATRPASASATCSRPRASEFLVLALPWRASDATIAWADAVDARPRRTCPSIITTHEMINIAADARHPARLDYGLRSSGTA